MLGQLVRFGGMGGIATLVHVLCALLAESQMHLSAQQANIAGFLAAVVLSYFGHSRFTFRAGPGSPDQVLRFAVVALAGYATSSLAVAVVTGPLALPFAAAMAVVAVAVPLASFVAMRLWVFRSTLPTQPTRWLGVALSAAITLTAALLFLGQPLTNDVVWYLVATRSWLDGAPLYDWIMEVNPPLNFYYTALPILLADALGVSDQAAQYVVVWILLFAVLSWCSVIIHRDFDLSPGRRVLMLLATAVVLVVPSLDSIGQREFYLVLLMMPWMLSRAAQRRSAPGAEATTALVAALGVCLKPYFVLFPLAVTVVEIAQNRSLRPVLSTSNLVFLLVGLAYVGFVAVVHPAYFTEIIPMARLVYSAYNTDPADLFARYLPEVLLFLLPFLAARLDRGHGAVPPVFLAAAIAGLLSYVLQAKGFGYHTIPLISFGLMTCFMLMLNSKSLGPVAATCGLACFGNIAILVGEGFYHNQAVVAARRLQTEVDFDSVLVLSSNVGAGSPVALATGTRWASRYPANWLVPGAINRLAQTDCAVEADLCGKLQALADRNRSDNIEDLVRFKPDLLVIDRDSDHFDRPNFDWVAFMAKDPAWAAIFSQYSEVAANGRFIYLLRKG